MSAGRLPAHVAVSAMLRACADRGGFGAVLHRGERDAGPVLLVVRETGHPAVLWERLPRADGTYPYAATRREDEDGFEAYLARRAVQDPDTWIVELEGRSVATLIHSLAG